LSQITASEQDWKSEEMICFVTPEMSPFDVQRKLCLASTYHWKQRKPWKLFIRAAYSSFCQILLLVSSEDFFNFFFFFTLTATAKN